MRETEYLNALLALGYSDGNAGRKTRNIRFIVAALLVNWSVCLEDIVEIAA